MTHTVHIPTIETPRLRLRAHTRADFAPLADMWASPQSRYMDGPLNRRDAWSAFANDCAGWVLTGHGCWAVDRRDTGAFIGQVGTLHPDHYPEPELGWVLFDHATGHGFASEAATAALTFLRDTFGWATVVSYIDRANTASIALAKRLGATLDESAPLPGTETRAATAVYRHRLSA